MVSDSLVPVTELWWLVLLVILLSFLSRNEGKGCGLWRNTWQREKRRLEVLVLSKICGMVIGMGFSVYVILTNRLPRC